MTFKKTILKTLTLLLDVVSWFLGGMFVNDVSKFVATAYTLDGVITMGVSLFTVAVFFLVKMIVDNLLANLDNKKVKKKAKKKAKKKIKIRSRKAVKLAKANFRLSRKSLF